jgi:hypothetical protein
MNEFLMYILNSTLSLSLLYLLFRIVMRKETFFKLNRIVLLLIVLCSMGIPMLNSPLKIHNPAKVKIIPTPVSAEFSEQDFTGIERTEKTKQTINTLLTSRELVSSVPQIFLYGYFSGCLIAFLMLIYQLVHIGILFKKARFIKREDFRLLIVDKEMSDISRSRKNYPLVQSCYLLAYQ